MEITDPNGEDIIVKGKIIEQGGSYALYDEEKNIMIPLESAENGYNRNENYFSRAAGA
jgi:hypothetical protein